MSVDTKQAAPESVASTGGMFSALVNRNYRIYLAGSFGSNIGTWMQRVAQDWLVLELSGGSAVAIGITTGLQFLPMLLFSAYGGLIADRFDKRRILIITQSWLALCATVLGLLAITGYATTMHVYVLAFLFGLGTAFDNPARQSFVSEVAGADHLPNAIGLNSATFHAARIVGPAVAGLVIAAFGTGWAILANGIDLRRVHRRPAADRRQAADHRPAGGPRQTADPRRHQLRPAPPGDPAGDVGGRIRRHVRDELPDDQRPDGAAGVPSRSAGVRHPRHSDGGRLAVRGADRGPSADRAEWSFRGADGQRLRCDRDRHRR